MNINTVGSWLNNNQGILALILFIAGLLVTFIIWLLRKIIIKNPKKSKPSPVNPSVKGMVNAGRDIHIGRDVIGEQHHITNNTYTSPESKNKDQPIVEVRMEAFTSAQGAYSITLIFKNIGNSPGIVYDMQLANERLEIANFTLPPHGDWVTRTFDISIYKVLIERNENATLEVIYKNIYNEPGKTIAKVIQTSRADGRFNIKGIEIVEYQTPDKIQKYQGSTIIIGSPLTSDLRNKKF
jgi:hypothetical protein